jgi:hypothetical protein
METILSKINDPTNREIYTEFIELLLRHYGLTTIQSSVSFTILNTLDYSEVERMAFHLSIQLQSLEARGFTLLFWQPSDIMVVNYRNEMGKEEITLYILASLVQLVPLDRQNKKQLRLVYPTVFPLPERRCSPEVLKMNVLPFLTHRSASYYSLALLCLNVLNLSLADMKGTKLFYFLERCLKTEPSERMLLYL